MRERGAALLLVLVLAYLVLTPLLFLVVSSLKPAGFPGDSGWTLGNYAAAYGDPEFGPMLGDTLLFVGGAVLLAVFVALCLVLLIERTDVRGRRLLRWLILLPMAAPPLLMGASWILLLSPRTGVVNQVVAGLFGADVPVVDVFTIWGMIFVEGLVLVPTAYLMLMPPARALDPALEEAALLGGASVPSVFRRVTVPLLRPSILATSAFLAIAGFVVFDVPGVIGLPGRVFVFSTRLFLLITESPTGLPQYGVVAALSVGLLGILVLLAFAYRQMTRQAERFAVVSGRSGGRRLIPLGRWRGAVSALPWAYVTVAGVVPLATLFWTSLLPYATGPELGALASVSLANHTALFRNPDVYRAVVNTLAVAGVAATLVAVLGGAAAWFGSRAHGRLARTIDTLSFAPVAVPGVLLGVALLFVYLTLTALPVYGTLAILIVAYVTMYLAYGSRSMGGVMVQLHGDLEAAARSCGAGLGLILRRVVVPLSLPGLVAVWSWVFIHAARELSAALMLRGPDNLVVTTLLWDYWSGGRATAAAALGVWLVVGMAAVIAFWRYRVAQR